MLIKMDCQTFIKLDQTELMWTCIEPTIQQIRGRDFTVKSRVFTQLTTGQRALLMFYVLYGHAYPGIAQFYRYFDDLLAKPDFWPELKAGAQYFEDDAMFCLVGEMESLYRIFASRTGNQSEERTSTSAAEINGNKDLFDSIDILDRKLRQIIPETQNRISTYIRENPGEFIQLDD